MQNHALPYLPEVRDKVWFWCTGSFARYTLPLVAWAMGITVLSLMPGSELPGSGIEHADKIGHGLAYAVLGALMLRGWSRARFPSLSACVTVLVTAVVWGGYLELLQSVTPDRAIEAADMAANGVGVAVGIGAWRGWVRRTCRPPSETEEAERAGPEWLPHGQVKP